MGKWKPINFKGAWNYDPRGEVRARAKHAQLANDDFVGIPLSLAYALADLHECDATTTIKSSPDAEPITIHCRLATDHQTHGVEMHFNGYLNWEDNNAEPTTERR